MDITVLPILGKFFADYLRFALASDFSNEHFHKFRLKTVFEWLAIALS